MANIHPTNPLQNTHFKLLAFDFNSLTPSPHNPNSFTRKSIPISRVEVFGVIVTRDFKPDKYLKFSIDDGTGVIQCILWLNHLTSNYFSRQCPSTVRSIAQVAELRSKGVDVGLSARVRGRVSGFRGFVQVTVEDVVVERDPNFDVLHWLDCVHLARRRYDVVSCKKQG